MIDGAASKYAYRLPAEKDEKGFFLPQVIIDSVLQEAEPIARQLFEQRLKTERGGSISDSLSRHHILIPSPTISLQDSTQLVIDAFSHFDLELGEKAKVALQNSTRWKLKQVQPGEAGGHCSGANTENNPIPYAVINYNYDNTINDALYMAHELGHLMADDIAASRTYPKMHMCEIQAFLLQHILYDYLINHQPDAALQNAARDHFNAEITRGIYTLPVALGALEAEREVEQRKTIDAADYATTVSDWLGPNWRAFNKANATGEYLNDPKSRDAAIALLHQHSMASIIAAGLFYIARQSPQQRHALLNSVLGEDSHQGLTTVLQHFGIESQEALATLSKTSVATIMQNVPEQGHAGFVSLASQNAPEVRTAQAIVR